MSLSIRIAPRPLRTSIHFRATHLERECNDQLSQRLLVSMAEMDGAESLLQEPPMSPAVSPPPSPGQNTSDLAESTPKKQPAQDMEQAQNGVVSSATVAGDNMKALDSSSHGSPSSDPALQNAGNVGDGIMGPPPRPSSSYKASEGNAKAARSMQGPQSIPPRSGSGDHLNHAAPVQVGNEGAVLGPSQAAHTHPSILSDEAGPHEEHASDGVGGIDDDENATVPIVEYPWRDLQERYHDSMKAFQDEENHVYTEFDRLNQVS